MYNTCHIQERVRHGAGEGEIDRQKKVRASERGRETDRQRDRERDRERGTEQKEEKGECERERVKRKECGRVAK